MSIEPGPIPFPQNDFGSLQGCFVEGSPEQRKRERRIRRRALIISVTAQAAILAAIILVPLFGKPQRIAQASVMPLPPYFHHSAPQRQPTPQPVQQTVRQFCATCYSPTAPNRPVPTGNPPTQEDPIPSTLTGADGNTQAPWGIGIDDNRRQPPPPPPQTPQRLHMTHLEPAMLLQRIQPSYPALARQIHREGQVELRAVIATDGTIQSLQVVSGDPLFLQSALDAVRQWRYRATVLNGQPVEIDTFITVIYSLQQ
jgi:periplasmic protein TonB